MTLLYSHGAVCSYQQSSLKYKFKIAVLGNDVYLRKNQGNLKGESVVAAILPPRMEVSYCTSGFFS